MQKTEITVIAPINIALIKYWGKRDAEKMIPLNDSISINIDSVYARTKVTIVSTDDASDNVVVNGKQLELNPSTRFAQCFRLVRQLAAEKLPKSACFRVESETNFPVKAGLASSAAGFAAIAYGLGRLLDLDTDTISGLARSGSGSACRSIYGGFVHWIAGVNPDGSDCRCQQLSDVDFWPNLRAIVVVASSRAKHDGSTDGMQRSVETSQLLQHRLKLVPDSVLRLKDAISTKNFPQLAEIVMKDSNQFHAVCADTYPPMFYLSDTSCQLIELVHAFNELHDQCRVAYTFDAGPNCCLLMEEHTLREFLPFFCHYFPNRKEDKFIRGSTAPNVDSSGWRLGASDGAGKMERLDRLVPIPDAVQYVIVSKLGAAPFVVEN